MGKTRETGTQAPPGATGCRVVPLPAIGGEWRSYRGLAQPFAAHAHDHYVIGRVVEGERELDLNGRAVAIGPGSIVTFNPGDVHGCRASSDARFAYDSVTIAQTVLGGVTLGCPAAKDVTAEADKGRAASAFDHLAEALGSPTSPTVLERTLALAALLATETARTAIPRAHEEAALRTYAHLQGHLADPASVTELAAREGLSASALIRAYRKRFAITPLQHLVSLRVERACSLLAQGASPAVVASEVGFSDQAHLTRALKERTGFTPAAYKEMAARR